MSEPQRERVHGLLEGRAEPARIPDRDPDHGSRDLLGQIEQRARTQRPRRGDMVRDPERYFVSIFGTPSSTATWGWRVEGHHVSLQFTIVNGTLVANSPFFFGSNPAEVREGPQEGPPNPGAARRHGPRAA